MNKIIISLACLLWCGLLTGQQALDRLTIEVSEVIREKNKRVFAEIVPIGKDGQNFYGYALPIILPNQVGGNKDVQAVRVDKSMRNRSLSKLILKKKNNKAKFEFSIWLNETYYVFSSFKNKKLSKIFLFIQSVDLDELELNDDAKKIAEIDYQSYKKFKSSSFDHEISQDSTKFLLSYNLADKRGKSMSHGMIVFNQELSKLWQIDGLKIRTSGKKNFFSFENYHISNIGDVYLMGKSFTDMDAYFDHSRIPFSRFFGTIGGEWKKKPSYDYAVVAYRNGGQDVSYYAPDFEGKQIVELNFGTTSDGTSLICSGLYAPAHSLQVVGSCSFQVEQGIDGISHGTYTEFDKTNKENQTELSNNDIRRESDDRQGYYSIRPIHVADNGDFWTLAELNDKRRPANNEYFEYFHQHIYIIKSNYKGEVLWSRKVDKKQYIRNQAYMSSFGSHFDKEQNLYLIYAEGSRSAKDRGFNKGMDDDKFNLYVVLADGDGQLSKKQINKNGDLKYLPRVRTLSPIGENSILFFARRNGYKFKYQYLRLDL